MEEMRIRYNRNFKFEVMVLVMVTGLVVWYEVIFHPYIENDFIKVFILSILLFKTILLS